MNFKAEYVQWKEKIHDDYFIQTNGEERFKETTTLNKKGRFILS